VTPPALVTLEVLALPPACCVGTISIPMLLLLLRSLILLLLSLILLLLFLLFCFFSLLAFALCLRLYLMQVEGSQKQVICL
jgi:hypothetical protein